MRFCFPKFYLTILCHGLHFDWNAGKAKKANHTHLWTLPPPPTIVTFRHARFAPRPRSAAASCFISLRLYWRFNVSRVAVVVAVVFYHPYAEREGIVFWFGARTVSTIAENVSDSQRCTALLRLGTRYMGSMTGLAERSLTPCWQCGKIWRSRFWRWSFLCGFSKF